MTAHEGSRGMGRIAARGAAVTIGGQAARIGVQLASVAVLARLLTPHDYGLVAMVVVVVGVGAILRDFGLSSAAVQARDLTVHQRDNLFWLNTAIGVGLGLVIAAGAPLLAAVYDRPELVGITRALAVTFVLSGLATQYRADLLRRLSFAPVALVDVVAPVLALAAATTVALLDGGYWALVAQNVTQAGVVLAGYGLAARWLPGRPRRGVPMGSLLGFGWRLAGTQLIRYAGQNTDALIIGFRFGPGPLGLYNRGFQLLMTPLTQLRSPTTTVALPVLSRLQDDEARYSDFLRRGQVALGHTIVVALGLVAGASDAVTDLFLGPGWASVTPILRLLAVAGGFQTLAYVGYWVYLSRSLTAELLRYTLLTSALTIVCVGVGSLGGVVGVAAGYALSPALEWPLSLWWLSRLAPIPTRALAQGALRILAVAGVVGVAAALTDAALAPAEPVLRVLACTAAAAATYALLATVVPPVRRDALEVLDTVRLARSARS